MSDLALLLFSDFLMPMPKTRRPRKKKKSREKKNCIDRCRFGFFAFCVLFLARTLCSSVLRSIIGASASASAAAASAASHTASASASASQSSAPRGYSLGFELKSYHFCCCCCCTLFFVFRFVLAPLSFGFTRVGWGVRLNNIYLIYFYFYFINLIFFNWTSSSSSSSTSLALFASQSDYWLFRFWIVFFFLGFRFFGFSTFVRSLCTLFKSYVVKPLFRPKHVCFNDFLLVLAPHSCPRGPRFDPLQEENWVQSIVQLGPLQGLGWLVNWLALWPICLCLLTGPISSCPGQT